MDILKTLPIKYQVLATRLDIFEKDIQEQFIKGTGKGGQKVNKTSSTVYLKHLPTLIEVKCQKHRERTLNRIQAYKLLIKKIELQKLGIKSEIASKIFKLKKQKAKRSKRSKEKILEQKSIRSNIKELRKNTA